MKRQQKIFLFSFLSILFLGSFLLLSFAFAQADPFGLQQVGEGTGLGGQDIRLTIAKIIRALLGLLGIIAVSIMLYGGFIYMTAGGNEEKIGTAKKILINGTIGLMIILSSVSIAQFIIMQLGKATGAIPGDVPPSCVDDDYASENKCKCYPDWPDCDIDSGCTGSGLDEGEDFILKSLSPVTEGTGMNNVVIRAIFNKSVADKFDPDEILDIKYKTQSVSSSFNFEFYPGTNRQLLQAVSTDEEFCTQEEIGEDASCLDFGNYRIEVRGDLESAEGYVIAEENDCGIFPLDAKFYVGENSEIEKLSYLDFDGIDGRVYIGGTSTADFIDDFSMSFWVYIDEQANTSSQKYIIDNFTGGNPGAGYLVYYTQADNPDDNKLRFTVRRDNPTLYEEEEKADQKTLATSISTSTWHHVTTIYAGDSMSLYLDGVSVGSLDLPDNYPLYKYGGSLVFGGTQALNLNEYSFKGKLDEVRIYEKVLLPEEILELSQSRESDNYDGLYAGYHFEKGEGLGVKDLFDGEYHGEISGGVEWVTPEWGQKTSDKIAPAFSNFGLLGVEDEEYLEPGKVYWVSTEISDTSGLGAYHIQINKEVIDGEEDENDTSESYLDGPRRLDGSDIPADDPFIFTYPAVGQFDVKYPIFTSHNQEKTTHYTLTLDAFDIDSNLGQAVVEYDLLPAQCTNGEQDDDEDGLIAEDGVDCGGPCPACQGDSCTADWQCVYGNRCVDNLCTPWPKIVEVDPMHGASGNWATIYGYHFGEEEGQVKFAIDQDGDGKVLGAEWADAIPISIVKDVACGKTWRDNYIIIELPDDDTWPQGVEGAIRVSINNNDEVNDATNDEYGPDLGLFLKDDVSLPGLCSVKTVPEDPNVEGVASAEPGTAIKIVGNSLGSGNISRVLYFDEHDVTHGPWSEKEIFADVPDINLFDETAVSVLVAGKKSNSLKFEIIDPNIPVIKPVITEINPTTTTPGSYVTIFGFGFGNVEGYIFIASSTAKAEDCVKKPTEAEEDEDCIQLDLSGFPAQCGNTWSNTQIIAKVPLDTSTSTYFLALRNSKGDYTSGVIVDAEVKEQPFDIIDGEPNPGICKIDPNSGVAPRLGDNTIKIYGDNFTSPNDTAKVYFWINSASSTLMSTWMNTGDGGVYPLNSIQGEIENQEIETNIPYIDKGSEVDGTSMVSGPIRVGVGDDRFSNSVKYTVKDCRGASADIKSEMDGYQCCEAEGPDQGKWKLNKYACIGETREAGYVWRFSSGLINAQPRVLEQCDVDNWAKKGSFDGVYPSPTPSVLWPTTGYDACINAVVAVKFNIPMDNTTVNSDTVKMYNCGDGIEPNCSVAGLVATDDAYPILTGENVLEIRSIPPDLDLATSTWYRVELSEGIMSAPKPDNLGDLASQVYNLQNTGGCVDENEVNHCIDFDDIKTAYYFEFKTGNFDCQMTDAEVEPKTYTTHYLGKLYSPDGVPPNPLYYFVWGFSDRECIVLSADQYAWDWNTDNDVLDINIEPKAGLPTSTSRVSLDALAEDPGVKVEASTGIIEEGEGYEKYTNNILDDIDKSTGLVVTSTESALHLEDLAMADFVSFENYEIKLKYTLDEIATSSMFEIPTPNIKSYQADRYLFDDGANYILVEDYLSGTNRTRKLVSNLWGSDPDFIHTYDEDNLLEWNRGDYRIINNQDGFKVFDLLSADPYSPVYSVGQKDSTEEYSPGIFLGTFRTYDSFKTILFGSIDELMIEKENPVENILTVISATNTTTVEVYPPVVIDYGPNCAEACVNSSFWVRFSRPMAQVTYNDNMELYECETESCVTKTFKGISKSDTSDILVFSANLNNGLLASSTWYQVIVKGGDDGVRAIGSITKGVLGKAMEEDFIWKFRTKSDPSPCKVDNVRINPDPFVAQVIGKQTKYSAIPRSQPDLCSSMGQELNPWSYGWSWQTGDKKGNIPENKWVASVTEFSFGTKMSPYCNLGCVLAGSTIPTSTDHAYLCGNGVLDPGEDCDIDDPDEEIGVSCTLDCLRPGNSLSGVEGEDDVCGNGGDPETNVGEECDPGGDKAEWKYCTQNCLNVGSSQEFSGDVGTPWCGSATVTEGEDCDLDLSVADISKMGGPKNEASAGCSESCLHLGTPLEQAWCDSNFGYEDECRDAISWCGNGIIESGEECEIMENNILSVLGDVQIIFNATENPADYCTNKCLLQDICQLASIPEKNENNEDGLRCMLGSEGCNNDCTLAGSSISYLEASLCGDGKVGVGESGFCEAEAEGVVEEGAVAIGNAVQRVYALGMGEVNEITLNGKVTMAQYTTIEATVESYFSIENGQSVAIDLDDAKVTGSGDYYIACGYEENIAPGGFVYSCSASKTGCFTDNDCEYYEIPGFDQPVQTSEGVGFCWDLESSTPYFNDQDNPQVCANNDSCTNFGVDVICKKDFLEYKESCEFSTGESVEDFEYNLCPFGENQNKKTYGVADNSCCYERPYRTDSYPLDSAGFTTEDEPVCPNTLIEFEFNGEIDNNSIDNNFVIAVGHEESDYNYIEDGLDDVTGLINSTVTTVAQAGDVNGFFQRIWNFVKRFFAGVFGAEANATKLIPNKVEVWCAGNISATSDVLNDVNVDGEVTASTIKLYLDTILPTNSYVAVYLKGGNSGITDIRGVGIRNNPEESLSLLQDSIVFYTGSEVCKIDSVEINPDQYLFSKPNTTHEFEAVAKTKSEQMIVNIPGQYDWELEWQPQDNEIVEIPAEGSSATTTITTFGVGNLEGSLLAVANVKITDDKDTGSEEGSHEGLVFTGITSIEVNFCENPWPARNAEDNWQPFEDGVYNFSFSYCADAGLSDNKLDDLPFLGESLEFVSLPQAPLQAEIPTGNCLSTGNECQSDLDCDGGLISVPGLDNLIILDSEDNGICWDEDLDKIYLETEGDNNSFIDCPDKWLCEEYTDGDISLCKKDFEVIDNHCQFVEDVLPVDLGLQAVLSKDILYRYVFFNDKNDDAFGVQIFKNSAETDEFEAKPIVDWYAERFDNLSSMQTIELAGYQGLTDGRNYYVNALNETPGGGIYSNVYLFSVNKDAQQNTLQMFEKILNSIEFNINITDHGSCLMEGIAPAKGLPDGDNINSITGVDCITDFDCRDLFGGPLEGTNGVCSNAKTKMFRDLARLPKIGDLQNKIIDLDFPELKAGTFLPGYTVSRWPTSWSKFGTQDEINAWVGCNIDKNGEIDDNIDSYTCWNAVSSTYHCPTFSSVYEYKFTSSTGYYMLHGPLEYFKFGSPMVKYFIDENYYNTEPWCLSEAFDDPTVFSPFGEKCGDGIVNPGEQCDPPFSIKASKKGMDPGSIGNCEYQTEKECADSLADCGVFAEVTSVLDEPIKLFSKTNKQCISTVPGINGGLIINLDESDEDNYQLFGCEDSSDCKDIDFYNSDSFLMRTMDNLGGSSLDAYSLSEFTEVLSTNQDQIICLDLGLVVEEQQCLGYEEGGQ